MPDRLTGWHDKAVACRSRGHTKGPGYFLHLPTRRGVRFCHLVAPGVFFAPTMHDDPIHRLRVLRDMINARPGSSLQGAPWPLRSEWLAEELSRVVAMLQSEPEGREGREASSEALLPR